MKKSVKVLLGILIPSLIVGGTIGGIALYFEMNKVQVANLDPPEIDFPVEGVEYIHSIWGYGNQGGDFHNGIDFGCNVSTNIIAWCDMIVADLTTFYNEYGGHWQTNVFLKFNDRFFFDCAFESWALNESFSDLQKDAINVEIGESIQRGEVLGELLYHGSGTHIHFGMYDQNEATCAYQYFSENAKAIFDPLWDKCGWGDDFWYDPPYTST